MLTIAVCDDNPHFAEPFRNMIYELCAKYVPENVDCRVLKPFSSGDDLKKYMEINPVSVAFLDIDMPGMTGFELARYICGDHPETVIIFVSSLDDFVYSSFEFSPFAFLRKSKIVEELPDCFRRVVEKCTSDSESEVFNTVDGEQVIRFRDIAFLENEANYYVIHTCGGDEYKCRGSLSMAEGLFEKRDFYRIQQSYIVSFEQIKKTDGRSVLMKTGEKLSVSRRCFNEFKTAYLRYLRKRF